MPALQELIDVYASFDEANYPAEDAGIGPLLDQFLPGASANRGWFGQLRSFLRPDLPPQPIDVVEAVTAISDVRDLTTPQKVRLLFGVSALSHIAAVAPDVLPSETINGQTPNQFLSGTFDALQPPPAPEPTPNGSSAAYEATADDEVPPPTPGTLEDFLDGTAVRFTRRNLFGVLLTQAAELKLVPDEARYVPLCRTSVKTIDGIECVVVDTVCRSPKVSLNQLKAVVNPFNWDKNYPDFFIDMAASPPAAGDEWHPVLETVGMNYLGAARLKTGLRYRVNDDEPGVARIDYDMCRPKSSGADGQVTVDRGFINMFADNRANPDSLGVRVRTRKVVHITNVLPFVQERLVCLTGYGTASAEFLFGNAMIQPRPEGLEDFDYHEDVPPENGQSAAASSNHPTPPSKHVATTAVKIWADSVQGATNEYFSLTQKWMAGNLQLADVASFSTTVAGQFISAPWRFLDAVNQPRYPDSQ